MDVDRSNQGALNYENFDNMDVELMILTSSG